MKQDIFHKKLGDNSIMAPFACGHMHLIYYNGESSKLERLCQAEKSLCPKCKTEKLKKDNIHIFVPYGYYKDHLTTARNIVKGNFDNRNKTIELWLPQNKVDEFVAETGRRYYEINNTPPQNNRSELTIIVKGNTKPIKDQLKNLGAKWDGKHWIITVSVHLGIDNNHNVWIPKERNDPYYIIIYKLEQLGCIPDYSKINW